MSTSKKSINDLHNSDLYLHFYGDLLTEARTAVECERIVQYCQLDPGQRILDLACGHGRHANALTRRGFEVVGIDMNSRFIDIAREEAQREKLNTEFVEGDILHIGYRENFDAVLLLYNTLGFFNEADSGELFHRIATALRPGGRAFIDTRNRDNELKNLIPYQVTEKGEDLMIDRLSFDPLTGTTTNQRTYLKDGVRYDTPFTMYSYHFQDLERMISCSGLEIEQVFGGWKQEPFDATARRMILILKK